MIAAVDTHIADRLKRLKQGGESVTVYSPGLARPKGKTEPPCFVVSHYLPPTEDTDKSRPYLDDYIPSDTTTTYIWPYGENDSNKDIEITGPESWTITKWPIPMKLYYQIDVLSVDEYQAGTMSLLISQLFPKGYGAMINDSWVRLQSQGPGTNLDEVEKPIFRRTHRFIATGVWIERLESWTNIPIQGYQWSLTAPLVYPPNE